MIEEVVRKYKTPTYVFDTNKLISRVSYLRKYLKNKNLVYAVKANTFIIKEIDSYVDRFEICSPGEFRICEELGIDYSKMVISGVYKDYETIDYMIGKCDCIGYFTIESINQYELLDNLTRKYSKKINVLIRLTSGNQFGVSKEDFEYIIEKSKDTNICILGIEYFSGTQKHSLKKIEKEVDILMEFVRYIEEKYSIILDEIEYGTGFPVFYFKDDIFNEDEFLKSANEIIDKISNKKISIELGRSVAASCGFYLTNVVDIKTNKNGNFTLLDGGIHQVVYYGQTMAMRIPHVDVIKKNKKEEKEHEKYNLYGSLCTVNDILVKGIELEKLDVGDTLVFNNVGAYSPTEGISLFLSRDLPKVVIIDKNNKLKLVRDTFYTSKLNCPYYR